MVTPKIAILARLAPALALLACATPKPGVVAAPAPARQASQNPEAPGPGEPALPDDGIRLPDMLAMPGEGEFHATRPTALQAGSEAGAVISRPPTDPPSRPKPKAADSE